MYPIPQAWLANASLICPGGLMEAISLFLREDALKTCPRSAEIYGCHFLNCSPAQLIFHARPLPVPHSHFSRCSRSKGTLVPWPFAGDATSLLSPELFLLRMATNKSESDTLLTPNEVVLGGNGMFTCNFL